MFVSGGDFVCRKSVRAVANDQYRRRQKQNRSGNDKDADVGLVFDVDETEQEAGQSGNGHVDEKARTSMWLVLK